MQRIPVRLSNSSAWHSSAAVQTRSSRVLGRSSEAILRNVKSFHPPIGWPSRLGPELSLPLGCFAAIDARSIFMPCKLGELVVNFPRHQRAFLFAHNLEAGR